MIYLDYAATTPICEEALNVYQKLSMDMYGNASDLHDAGGKAKHILEYCREKIADIIGGEASGIYFTSGGTESNFLAIQSLLNGLPKTKDISLRLLWSISPFITVLLFWNSMDLM